VQLDDVRQQRWTGVFADVREARDFAARGAVDWSVHDKVDDLCLVTSELATNAVVHARTGFSVVVGLTDRSIVVEVTDGSDGMGRSRARGRPPDHAR
jgi:anti-sigma regulatory factor (Ser/Thr protein kinase)